MLSKEAPPFCKKLAPPQTRRKNQIHNYYTAGGFFAQDGADFSQSKAMVIFEFYIQNTKSLFAPRSKNGTKRPLRFSNE